MPPYALPLLLATALVGAAPQPSSALAAADGQSSTVELLGGTDSRSIKLSPVVVSSGKKGTQKTNKKGAQETSAIVLQGDLHLALRNLKGSEQVVRVFYARADRNVVKLLATTSLNPYTVGDLPLHFRLSAPEAPDALDGTLDVETGPSRHPTEQFSVPVTGVMKTLGDVHFEPATAVVRVTRWCLIFSCNTESGGTVRLYGNGVGQLLRYLKAAGETSVEATLFRDDSAVDASLTDLSADSNQPGTATASLELGGKTTAGKYTGTLALSRLVPDAPGLSVEVHSRYWVVWAILAILLGVLAAGALYQQLGLWRRKRLLKGALEEVVNKDYGDNRDLNHVDGMAGQHLLIWDLKIDYPLKTNPAWDYWDDLDTANNVYTAIRWARGDADLDEAQTAAVTLIHDVKSWLLALTEVRGLWELATAPHKGDWKETRVLRDTKLVLVGARRTPGDALLSSKLLALVEQQTAWHRRFAEAWDLQRALLDQGKDPAQEAADVPLKELDAKADPITTRTREKQDELDLELDELYQCLLKIRAQHASDMPIPIPSADREEQAAARRAELDSLRSSALPEVALASAGASGITALAPVTAEVEGEVTAPVEAPQPTTAQPTTTATAESIGPLATVRRSTLLRRLRLLDLLLSAATLLITSILYAATVYTDTWGTVADFGTAFGAGFLGQVTVKWALLPIYRSIRVRPITAETTGAAAGNGAGAAA